LKPEEWKRVRALVDAALQRDPEERDGFLDEACAGRLSLRAAVASLLRAEENEAHGTDVVQTYKTPPPGARQASAPIAKDDS
jgi:hypothetical protein